jgi:hypothetical protein
MTMPQPAHQANLVKQALIVALSVNIHQRYLQRNPQTFHAVLGLPDLARAALSQALLKTILAQAFAPRQIQSRFTRSFAHTCPNHYLAAFVPTARWPDHITTTHRLLIITILPKPETGATTITLL